VRRSFPNAFRTNATPPAVTSPAFRDEAARSAVVGPLPECRISYDAATRPYGFSFRHVDKPLHFEMHAFETLDGVMAWAERTHLG
jgi:hypothetical protein